MPGQKRTERDIAAKLHSDDRAVKVAGRVREMRRRRRWTQAELARRTGVGRMVIGRLERGQARLDLDLLDRIAEALGVWLTVDFGRDPREDVANAGHLAMQELMLRLARKHGLERQFELATRPAEPWRSIDVAVGSEAQRVIVDEECWNVIGDIGAAWRSSARKLAELEQAAVGRWGENGRAALVWVVRDSTRNRTLVARYPEVFASRFTGSSRAWVEALTSGGPIPTEPGLVWCDVRKGRIYAWRKAVRPLAA
ncbi:MAG TPA: helix-turn-helix transcriptional regulator [Candidatus Binatia bacterium]|nr:helix-turn-helix transcriptional regulator [Candidatus Binatia bacterium]